MSGNASGTKKRPFSPLVFDDAHYASSWRRKLKRSLQLGPRYYFWDLPRYLVRRRQLSLSGWDIGAFINPVREFRAKRAKPLPLPGGLEEVLARLFEVGTQISLPQGRLEALVGAWWSAREAAGDVIECGSYKGATALVLALLAERHGLPGTTLQYRPPG